MNQPPTQEHAVSNVRLAVIYYSTYGTNHQMAEVAAAAAREAGAEVRLLKVRETAPAGVVAGQDAWRAQAARTAQVPEVGYDDMEWANAYLFSAPTRYGVSASQLRAFIDTLGPLWQQGKLANKAVSAMSSAQNPHGGQESTILGLYTTMMHWGAVIVAPGYTDPAVFGAGGNPYGTSVTATGQALTEESKAAIRHQARRLVEMAEKLAVQPVGAS
jgi:NAD(P)H dehydrogenase (quinone)